MDTVTGIVLLITHIIACLTVGFLFRFWGYKRNIILKRTYSLKKSSEIVSFSTIGEILGSAIMNSFKTIVLIGGFVLIFSVIISELKITHTLQLLSNILRPLFLFLKMPERSYFWLCLWFIRTNKWNKYDIFLSKQIDYAKYITFKFFAGVSVDYLYYCKCSA